MFGISAVTSILECLIFMPISFTVFSFVMPPELALLLSGTLCLIALFANWLCKLNTKGFLYKIISLTVSILIGLSVTKVSIGTLFVATTFMLVFIVVRQDIYLNRDSSFPIVTIAILINIVFALVNVYRVSTSITGYSNATIFISTVAAVILLILKQVDDSRRFGKSNMAIGTTHKKNNRVFAGIALVLLIAVSSIGQVSKIYMGIIGLFIKFFGILSDLFIYTKRSTKPASQTPEQIENGVQELSTFEKVFQTFLTILLVVVILAAIIFLVSFIVKVIIKLTKYLINWFKNKEQIILRYSEDGHIDEKQSLYNRNFKNFAKNLRDKAQSLFDREIPYNKLPGVEKIRRLFKYYLNKTKRDGVVISNSLTAQEICARVSDKAPETDKYNRLLSKCYDAARYDEAEPLKEELIELESKLLR